MLQTQATRAVAPVPAAAGPAPASAAASNQARQTELGLGGGASGGGGSDILSALRSMGAEGAVVLDALPLVDAYRLAKQLASSPAVHSWLACLGPEALGKLGGFDPAGVADLVFGSGSSVEVRLSGCVAIALGVATEGSFSLARRESTLKIGFVGMLGALAGVGVGGGVGYEGLDRTGASGSAQAQLAVRHEAEWTLDPALVLGDAGLVVELMAGRAPAAETIAALVRHALPTKATFGYEASGVAEGGAAAANADVELLPEAPLGGAGPAMAIGQGMEAGTNLAFALFSGVAARLRASARLTAGWDEDGALLSVEVGGGVVASVLGLDAQKDDSLVIEARAGGSGGGSLRDTIRGTVILRSGGQDDAGSTTMTWQGVAMLDALLASLSGAAGAVGTPDFAPGELLVQREHRIDDPKAIEALLGGMPAYDGLLRVVMAHVEARYQARVQVRMTEDTAAGMPGPRPGDVEAARDRQRALAAVVLGESYQTDLPVYLLGVDECASLDEATLTLVVEAGVGLSGEVDPGAKVQAGAAAGATYKREVDVAAGLAVADVGRLLTA
ncbi:MAG: hypothetical protein EXR71_10570 [Myxococcales bacterium]|nr:hypothetical protein [Myxococcales bacterium]